MRWQYFLTVAIRVFSFSVIFLVGRPQTEAAAFIVDSSQSQLTISGNVSGSAFTAQGSGSMTAAYMGNLNAAISGSTIQFTGLSTIIALTNGVWQPAPGGVAGSAPANYGAQALVFVGLFPVTAYGAGRNLVLDLTSPLLTLTGTNFNASTLVISLVTNSNPVFDFYSGIQNGSNPMSGDSTNSVATGSFISTNGGLVRVVIQINTTFTTTNSVLTLTGTIVATNSLSAFAPPVITRLVATNQNWVLTVSNATSQSQLFSSTNLTAWSAVSATTSTNGGFIIFKTPMTGPRAYFRIQK